MKLSSHIANLMHAHGFHLVRQTGHLIWRDTRGHTIVTGRSNSDWRAFDNIKAQLARIK
jgi:predicted RNA binding protein YcfA (HicA-like mRNA interferase family)